MTPEQFLEVAEAALLKDIGERLRSFFAENRVEYLPDNGDVLDLYKKHEAPNPYSTIQPLAQVNMVANVTFHLMAQQLAILFHERPGINKQRVFETTLDNIKRLVVTYTKTIKDGQDENNGEGPTAGSAD